jgi:hypothetical protein
MIVYLANLAKALYEPNEFDAVSEVPCLAAVWQSAAPKRILAAWQQF